MSDKITFHPWNPIGVEPAKTRLIDLTVEQLREIIREEVSKLADDTPKWLSYEAAAEYAGVSINTIRNWAAQGLVEKHGNRRRARLSRKSIDERLARPRRVDPWQHETR